MLARGTIILSFAPGVDNARLVMRALPPITCFHDYETIGSHRDCPICIKEFKNEELIQPFGVCVHEFHSSASTLGYSVKKVLV